VSDAPERPVDESSHDLRALVEPARREDEAAEPETESVSGSVARAPLLRPLLRVPLKKVAIWAVFGVLLFVLKDFFPLIFMTFVLSYISLNIVDRFGAQFTSRKIPVVLVFACIVGAVVALGFATVPKAWREGNEQLTRLGEVDDPKVFIKSRIHGALSRHPTLKALEARVDELTDVVLDPENMRAAQTRAREWLTLVLQSIWKGVVFTLLALLFSFMLVWDAPRISAEINKLRMSRLGPFYDEVAPSIATFGRLLGRAFEAQTWIALLNTCLTAIGLTILGVNGIGLLSVIVFLCSFIPIAGVFISTVPMCLVALTQKEGSPGLVIGVIVMIVIVHIIEAYVLNPRIYGHHMKLHPLAVLVVLYVAEKVFGLMGLIVAVPLATYVWRHVIMGEMQSIAEPAAKVEGGAAPAASAG
jgi:predicted PurR-regulated permease PerM